MGGPLLHAHFQFENAVVPTETEVHQFTLHAALAYYSRLTNSSGGLISDTNHALLDIWRDKSAWQKKEGESRRELYVRQIKFASSQVLKRANNVRGIPGFLTGVETDIVDSNGKLSTYESVLRKLDIVIASLHWRVWQGYGGGKTLPKDSKRDIIKAYVAVARNPHVDIIGHPGVLPLSVKPLFNAEDYKPVLDAMKSNGCAFEINLTVDLENQDNQLERDVIRLVAKEGVKISIGIDLHHLRFYNVPGVYGEYITLLNWEKAYHYHESSGFHATIKDGLTNKFIYLESLGVRSQNIINSSMDAFLRWKESRGKMVNQVP